MNKRYLSLILATTIGIFGGLLGVGSHYSNKNGLEEIVCEASESEISSEEIIKSSKKKLSALKSFYAVIQTKAYILQGSPLEVGKKEREYCFVVDEEKGAATGKIYYNSPNLVRVSYNDKKNQRSFLKIADGNTIWQEYSEGRWLNKHVAVMKVDLKDLGSVQEVGHLEDNLRGLVSFKKDPVSALLFGEAFEIFEGFENFDFKVKNIDQRVYILEGERKNKEDIDKDSFKRPKTIALIFDRNTGFPYRIELLAKDGTSLELHQYSNVRINPKLSEKLFSYTPPPNAELFDLK